MMGEDVILAYEKEIIQWIKEHQIRQNLKETEPIWGRFKRN